MFCTNVPQNKWIQLLVLVCLFPVAAVAQERAAALSHVQTLHTLKGSVAFAKGYSPQKGDRELLKGVLLVLKDRVTGAELGRATTDADGNFTFNNVTGSGANPMNARQVCNEKGDCFDFQPLKPDDPPPLEPIIVEDPPLQMKRVGHPTPRLVLKPLTCTSKAGGPVVKMAVIKSESAIRSRPKAQ